MKIFNLSRYQAKFYQIDQNDLNYCWINITEPETEFVKSSLEQFPNLKIKFWDVVETLKDLNKGKDYNPPSKEDAKSIVDFLFENSDKNVLVNCAAGVSRSGAVAKFAEDYLNYKWDETSKRFSKPNPKLYQLMVDYYESL